MRTITLKRQLGEADVVPAVNQIELHPNLAQQAMRALDAEHGITTEAWSPLGQGKQLLGEPVLSELATKHDKSPAQVVLRRHLQTGTVAIPKSVTPERSTENIDVFDFSLDDGDMRRIAELDNGERLGADPDTMNYVG